MWATSVMSRRTQVVMSPTTLTINNLVSTATHSILGRGVIVHEKADDLKTQQPPGNAGGRLAVGVVGVAKP